MKSSITYRRRFLRQVGFGAPLLGVGAFAGCGSAFAGLDVRVPEPSVAALAERLTVGAESETDRAVALYCYVRDEIRFGFTPAFDAASPAETVAAGKGHCNPKSALFATLLHAAGIEAQVRFYTIDSRVLRGVFSTGVLDRLSHAVTEIHLDGRVLRTDGCVADPMLLAGAKMRLGEEARELGYGAHRDGEGVWDGTSDVFSQLVADHMIEEEHGAFTQLEDFYESERYVQRLSVTAGFGYRWAGIADADRNLASVRDSVPSEGA